MTQEIIHSIKQGKLRGRIAKDLKGEDYYSFQGIPYAKPPLGELRFKAPRPAEPWNGTWNATKEGNVCFSRDIVTQQVVGSEDCLFLNVYTPSLPSKGINLLPVMVWIHGGGFTHGSGNSDFYGPEFLISQNVIVVTINYRLGLLGFLNFEDASLNIPGNAGLKDQVMALRWIKENISSFNGNPDNVTIFGESAGAGSIHHLVLSPMAAGLFHKAIAQSGSALCPWANGQRTISYLQKNLNLPKSATDKEALCILQNMTSSELLDLQFKTADSLAPSEMRLITPVVETICDEPAFLLEDPMQLIKSGRFNHVPMVFGYTSNEGILLELMQLFGFKKAEPITDFESQIPFLLQVPRGSDLSKKIAQKIKYFYFGHEQPSAENMECFQMLFSDVYFNVAVQNTAQHHVEASSKPVYFYRFDLDTKLNTFKQFAASKSKGASHFDDCGYLFKNSLSPEIRPNSLEEQGVYKMTKLWANFARTGNPNSTDNDPSFSVTWKPMEKNVFHYMSISDNLTVGVEPDFLRMELWNEIEKLALKQ